jgi:glycerol-3-phosphate dehydrogenase
VVNAAGVWVDELRQRDGALTAAPGSRATPALVAPSQGVHLVVGREFLDSDVALMVPKTADGRVLFAVPWLGKVILGTTDTPRTDLAREPLPFPQEIDFILNETARYLVRVPRRADVKSVWVGLRPLVKPPDEAGANTKGLSREHTVLLSRSGLVTVTGGKWTTYRAMADDVLSQCVSSNLLAAPTQAPSARAVFKGAGAQTGQPVSLMAPQGMHLYGTEQAEVAQLPGVDHWLLPGLSEAMVRFAARFEFARTVEDVLARRSRALFLDAKASIGVAALVADLLMEEGCTKVELSNYLSLAQTYTLSPEVRDRPL